MTERISSTASAGESLAWNPVGETLVQAQVTPSVAGKATDAVVELHAKAETNAPFAIVASIKVASEAFISTMKFTTVKLVFRGNNAGDTLKVWSAE